MIEQSNNHVSIIRAIPAWSGGLEQYYNATDLPWDKQNDFREELKRQGFISQDIMLSDPMPVLVAIEIRQRFEAEQKKA